MRSVRNPLFWLLCGAASSCGAAQRLEIEVHHGWPAIKTFLTYKNPTAYRQMKAEQNKLKRKAEAERNRAESQAF